MLRKLKTLFAAPATSPEELEQRAQVAAAALLFELSRADYRSDERELAAIAAAVRTCFPLLGEDLLQELLREAEAASKSSTSLYEFTSLLNQNCSDDEKFGFISHLWQVAGADGNIDKYEDHLIRKIAELLYVSHQQFIRAKLEVLGHS